MGPMDQKLSYFQEDLVADKAGGHLDLDSGRNSGFLIIYRVFTTLSNIMYKDRKKEMADTCLCESGG